MAINRSGQVIVNPRVPLGLPEFEQLYRGEGSTPEEAASRIHMDYPTEAKSYMSSQWSRLNTGQSPEQYFSNPNNQAATLAAAGQPVRGTRLQGAPPQSGAQWPSFNNDMERNIAISTGAYDPQFASPLAKTYYEVETAKRQQDLAQVSDYQRRMNPVDIKASPEAIRAAQLAGDTFGDTKRILQRLQNGGVTFDENTGNDLPTTGPYVSPVGYGGGPSQEDMRSTLDFDIVQDSDFRKIAAQDPKRASHVYRSLTGREYEADVARHNKVQDIRIKHANEFTTKQLQDGAVYNPKTKTWQVWQFAQGPDTGMPGQETRAQRRLVDATPEQNMWMNSAYEGVTNRSLPILSQGTAANYKAADSYAKSLPPEINAAAIAAIEQAKKDTGKRNLTAKEEMLIIASVANKQAEPGVGERVVRGWEDVSQNATPQLMGGPGDYMTKNLSGTMDTIYNKLFRK